MKLGDTIVTISFIIMACVALWIAQTWKQTMNYIHNEAPKADAELLREIKSVKNKVDTNRYFLDRINKNTDHSW